MKISELPEPYRKLAELRRDKACENPNQSDWLEDAFIWEETPEGHYFWSKCHEAKDAAELPPIPYCAEADSLNGELLAALKALVDDLRLRAQIAGNGNQVECGTGVWDRALAVIAKAKRESATDGLTKQSQELGMEY